MAFAADLPDDESLGRLIGRDAASQSHPAPAGAPESWLKRHKVTVVAYAIGLLLLGSLAAQVHSTLLEITAPVTLGGPIEIAAR